jgi:hypothetical protein
LTITKITTYRSSAASAHRRPTYKRNYLLRDQPLLPGDAIRFDVVTEQVFPNRAAFESWLAVVRTPGNRERVHEDEVRFLDHSSYFAYVAEEHVTT